MDIKIHIAKEKKDEIEEKACYRCIVSACLGTDRLCNRQPLDRCCARTDRQSLRLLERALGRLDRGYRIPVQPVRWPLRHLPGAQQWKLVRFRFPVGSWLICWRIVKRCVISPTLIQSNSSAIEVQKPPMAI